MKIYAEPRLRMQLEGMLHRVAWEFGNFTVVKLEIVDKPGDNRSDFKGIDIALAEAPKGQPVIMVGWMDANYHIQTRPVKWFALMGYANVTYLQLPVLTPDFATALKELRKNPRQPDPLAIALYNFSLTASSGETPVREPFAGREFPDICIDESALFMPDGALSDDAIQSAVDCACGGPISVLAGDNIVHVTRSLRDAGVRYKVVHTDLLGGATFPMIITDQHWALLDNHGINFKSSLIG